MTRSLTMRAQQLRSWNLPTLARFALLLCLLVLLTPQAKLMIDISNPSEVAEQRSFEPVVAPSRKENMVNLSSPSAAKGNTEGVPIQPSVPTSKKGKNADDDCPFRNSSIYRSIYVYPSPGSEEWNANSDVWSNYAKTNFTADQHAKFYPWFENDRWTREKSTGAYDIHSQMVQYNTELLVQLIVTHPDSCLRTYDPETAKLFYVPYLPSAEFHNGSVYAKSYDTSPYGNALLDAVRDQNYDQWERIFGLTSKYWSRRNGSDHILVYSEPMHGLYHPRSKRGNFHFIHSQQQLAPPLVISIELSTTFVEMYPNCARKNILMPYPNTNGRWFNGYLDQQVLAQRKEWDLTAETSRAALAAERELASAPPSITTTLEQQQEQHYKNNTTEQQESWLLRRLPRPLSQYYSAGAHGTCTNLRKAMNLDYKCSESGKYKDSKQFDRLKNYALGYRQATFCPCPGGDSPSAKRMFDALHAGCIPIILSHDFVWPLTSEFDTLSQPTPNHLSLNTTTTMTPNHSEVADTVILLDPNDYSIRLQAKDYVEAKHDEKCQWKPSQPLVSFVDGTTSTNDDTTKNKDLQAYLDSISSSEIQRLRKGAERAADIYSYYPRSPDLPENPLKEGILPTGGAAHALVQLLGERADGKLWPACRDEVRQRRLKFSDKDEPKQFKC